MQFTDLSIDPAILRAISELKFTTLTEVQAEAIPQLLNSDDVHLFAQAKTGTGKTVAYSIPIAHKINPNLRKIQAIVLVPTRELCNQVNTVISSLIKYQKIHTVEIYGGVSYNPQIKKIKNGAQIVIATPGRFIDMYERGSLKFDHVKFLVLDEADRMLDFGFMPAIEHIFKVAMQSIRPRIYFFSATLKDQIYTLAQQFIHQDPVIKIDVSHDTVAVQSCSQYYYVVEDQASKFESFVKIFNQEQPGRSIIFVNKKDTAEKLTKSIRRTHDLNLRPDLLSGDLSQKQRETTIQAFRENKIDCLVATDVAARGLDFTDITHVFNYDIPCFEEDYVHRIGRTSRMESAGTAVSICLANQKQFLIKIEKFIRQNVEEKTLPGIKIEFKGGASRVRSRRRHSDRDGQFRRSPRSDQSLRISEYEQFTKPMEKKRSENTFYSGIVAQSLNPEGNNRSEKTDRPAQSPKPEWKGRSENTERPNRSQKPEWRGRSENTARPARSPKSEWKGRSENTDRPARSIRKNDNEHAHKSPYADRPQRTERNNRKEGTDRLERSNRPLHEEIPRKPAGGFFDQQESIVKAHPLKNFSKKEVKEPIKHKRPSKLRRHEARNSPKESNNQL